MTGNASSLSLPHLVWDWYLEYLVFYEPGSWIATAASTFRILAFLVVVPFILLTSLDVTSYVIARTLGVVDDTKASTSDTDDKTEIMLKDSTPTVLVNDESAHVLSDSDSDTETSQTSSFRDHRTHNTRSKLLRRKTDLELPKAYFVTPTEESMKLSGFGVFSPAASRPASPMIDRSSKRLEMEAQSAGDSSWPNSLGSSSGDSSYVMWGRDSSPEDADADAALRRRRPDTHRSQTAA